VIEEGTQSFYCPTIYTHTPWSENLCHYDGLWVVWPIYTVTIATQGPSPIRGPHFPHAWLMADNY